MKTHDDECQCVDCQLRRMERRRWLANHLPHGGEGE
jgi:hypothetical protein